MRWLWRATWSVCSVIVGGVVVWLAFFVREFVPRPVHLFANVVVAILTIGLYGFLFAGSFQTGGKENRCKQCGRVRRGFTEWRCPACEQMSPQMKACLDEFGIAVAVFALTGLSGWLLVFAVVIPNVLFGLAYFLSWRQQDLRSNRRRAGRCAECGYDLTGNVSGVCPECGMAVVGCGSVEWSERVG